ncbi:MAG: tetratricopeptide repeat protein [Promethearchaeota archaeon]|nr:MAG: tetratricopeptide repeat protein [Candidatus Lokiarchaeota archaeon]
MDEFDSLFAQGHALVEEQIWEKAIEKLEKAAKLDDSYSELWFDLAYAYESINYIRKAIQSYEKALKIEPDNIRILNNLANCYRKIDEFSKAEDCYNKIFEINPDSIIGWFSRSEMLKRKGDLEGAINGAKHTLELAEEKQEAYFLAASHYNLACYMTLNGKKELAKKHLQQAIDINPNLEQNARQDPDLQALNYFA